MGGDTYCHGLETVCGGGWGVRFWEVLDASSPFWGGRCGGFPGMCVSDALRWVVLLGMVVGVFAC